MAGPARPWTLGSLESSGGASERLCCQRPVGAHDSGYQACVACQRDSRMSPQRPESPGVPICHGCPTFHLPSSLEKSAVFLSGGHVPGDLSGVRQGGRNRGQGPWTCRTCPGHCIEPLIPQSYRAILIPFVGVVSREVRSFSEWGPRGQSAGGICSRAGGRLSPGWL